MQHKAQRVGVFVDVQNMYYSARALFEQKVDFGEILKEAVGQRQLVRAFAYAIQAENDEEGSFFEALEGRGYEVKKKQLLNFYGGNSKGDWDIGIAMDIVRMLPKLDVVVLASGDGDFADLLRYVKSRGVRAEVIAFGSSTSSALREEAETLFDLSSDPKRFLIGRKTQPIQKKQRTNEGEQYRTVHENELLQTPPKPVTRTNTTTTQPQAKQKLQQQVSRQSPNSNRPQRPQANRNNRPRRVEQKSSSTTNSSLPPQPNRNQG